MAVIVPNLRAVLASWNHGLSAHGGYLCEKGISIVATVGNHIVGSKGLDQGSRLADVMALPASQEEAQRIPECINNHMDLGGIAATAAA
jgi:hypothetical protein